MMMLMVIMMIMNDDSQRPSLQRPGCMHITRNAALVPQAPTSPCLPRPVRRCGCQQESALVSAIQPCSERYQPSPLWCRFLLNKFCGCCYCLLTYLLISQSGKKIEKKTFETFVVEFDMLARVKYTDVVGSVFVTFLLLFFFCAVFLRVDFIVFRSCRLHEIKFR